MKILSAILLAVSAPLLFAQQQPNVLIIGDSISLGYTPHVIRMMQGKARVVHNRGNAQHTGTGLKKIDNWLGDTNMSTCRYKPLR